MARRVTTYTKSHFFTTLYSPHTTVTGGVLFMHTLCKTNACVSTYTVYN